MRLLNTTSLTLGYFVGAEIPKYAILSHRWEDEEILFEDVQTNQWRHKKGADKVERACLRAKSDGFDYIWIGTCCIDKSSSAELSEAINSMFNWYHESQVCYAYLFDVPRKDFNESEWFTRGWTLQELIAPNKVQFFDSQWRKIGDRLSLLDSIVKVTAVDQRIIGRGQHHRPCPILAKDSGYSGLCRCRTYNSSWAFRQLLSSISVATRMSWASRRVTTRLEDEAYALLGLFNVSMPLLYGEGTRAFRRLQEEIIRNTNDQSILAGQHQLCTRPSNSTENARGHLFPPRPQAFRHGADLEQPSTSQKYLSMTLTNRCLNIELHVCPCSARYGFETRRVWLGILGCVYSDDCLSRPAILLDRLSSAGNGEQIFRRSLDTLIRISPGAALNGDGEVEIHEAMLSVQYNPSYIKMENISLLIHPHTRAQRMRTPAVRIGPTVGGNDDLRYRIRISFPELREAPNGHMIRDPQERKDNAPGLLAIDDGSGHGFFVAYGFSVHRITDTEALDTATTLEFDHWCRLLQWHQAIPGRGVVPKDGELANTLESMTDLYNSIGLLRSHDNTQPYDSLYLPGRPGVRAQVVMTPNTFLGQTVYDLQISVWKIDGSSETQGMGRGTRVSNKRLSRHW